MNIKNRLAKVNIGIKLTVLSAIALLVAIAALLYISKKEHYKDAIVLNRISTTNLSQSLGQILRYSMLGDRPEEIADAILSLSKSEEVQNVYLAKHSGEIVYSAPDSNNRNIVGLDDKKCSCCHIQNEDSPLTYPDPEKLYINDKENDLAYSIVPIYTAEECYESDCHAHDPDEIVLGAIEIVISTDYISEALDRSDAKILIYSLLIAAFVALVLMFFRRKWIVRPIRDLITGTKLVANGDLDHNIPQEEGEFGELATAFNVMQDKLKSTQKQLIMTGKLVSMGKLASGVAHEINNPLTGILAFTEGLLEEADPDDPNIKDYEIIKRETLRCRTIVKDLLDFTRQNEPDLSSIDINDVIHRTIELLKKQAKFANININMNIEENTPEVLADAGQLQQVILNLMINSAEAMPDGGNIEVRTYYGKNNDSINIKVKDNGKGIPELDMERIFEPFFSTKNGKTNGLGLAICWDVIKMHKGDIKVHSKIGEGTEIDIVLPALSSDIK
ncbi:sensor histidine kinase [candidate division KSB1 bacterium]